MRLLPFLLPLLPPPLLLASCAGNDTAPYSHTVTDTEADADADADSNVDSDTGTDTSTDTSPDTAASGCSSDLECTAPPEVDVAGTCAKSDTMDVFLGPGCGATCDRATGTCIYAPTTLPCPGDDARLPQDHGWEVALRSDLGSLTEADFEIPLDPLVLDEGTTTEDDWFALWLLSDSNWYYAPPTSGLRLPASRFLLSSIEREDGVYGGNIASDINGVLFWERWAYPGNPHHGRRAARLRALAMSAVDLMMLDQAHDAGSYAGQLYLSGTMTWLSGSFLDAKDDVDACTAAAYAMGLRTMFDRLEAWDTNNGNNDMAQPGHVGMYEAGVALEDPVLADRALAESEEMLSADYWHADAGYLDHGTALDSSYEGISLHFLTWGALGTPYAHLDDMVSAYSRLKAHLTLPEPDGVCSFSPSHWNPATAAGAAEDQWWTRQRDMAAAMVTDEALYLAVGGRYFNAFGYPTSEAQVQKDVRARLATVNADSTSWGLVQALDSDLPAWQETHWSHGRGHATLYMVKGFLERLLALQATDDALLRPPATRGGEYVASFGDDFVVVRLGGYAAIVYSGPIADEWAAPLSGFGGGALSAFWTPEGGSFVLGLTHGSQNPNPDQWSDVEIWATHHLFGITPSGGAFSTALVQVPDRVVSTTSTSAQVVVSGTIGAEAWSDAGVLSGSPTWERTFSLDEAGVTVATTFVGDDTDEVCELVEAIPLFLRDTVYQSSVSDPVIRFVLADGSRVDATTTWTAAVAVEVERFDGSAMLTLDEERRVRMAPSTWTNAWQNYPSVWTLHIDVLGGDDCVPMPTQSWSWSLTPGEADG